MRIEGFTFLRNARKLGFPADASIRSALPLSDRFTVALGKGDPDDDTEEMLNSIGSDKIRKLHTEWDPELFPKNTVYAQQADIARSECKGDWLLYLQGDEALHEADHPLIRAACERFKDDPKVEGLLFRYLHFWGDHEHVHFAHNWYPREVRMIKNDPAIHPWKDAQSFRYYRNFGRTPQDFLKKRGTRLLRVAKIDARIFHYGGMRSPSTMARKKAASERSFQGMNGDLEDDPLPFDHGPLHYLDRYEGSHPQSMEPYIRSMDWRDRLQFRGGPDPQRPRHKHERWKYRFLGFLERRILDGDPIAGAHNYRVVRRFSP